MKMANKQNRSSWRSVKVERRKNHLPPHSLCHFIGLLYFVKSTNRFSHSILRVSCLTAQVIESKRTESVGWSSTGFNVRICVTQSREYMKKLIFLFSVQPTDIYPPGIWMYARLLFSIEASILNARHYTHKHTHTPEKSSLLACQCVCVLVCI